MTGWRWVALAVAVLLLVGGTAVATWLVTRSDSSGSSASASTRGHVLGGSVGAKYVYQDLRPSSTQPGAAGDPCDLVAPGNGQVVVTDANGRVIGAGNLIERGVLNAASPPPGSLTALWDCTFTFSIPVPDTPFYTVKIGRWNPVTLPKARLAQLNWQLAFMCPSASTFPCAQPSF